MASSPEAGTIFPGPSAVWSVGAESAGLRLPLWDAFFYILMCLELLLQFLLELKAAEQSRTAPRLSSIHLELSSLRSHLLAGLHTQNFNKPKMLNPQTLHSRIEIFHFLTTARYSLHAKAFIYSFYWNLCRYHYSQQMEKTLMLTILLFIQLYISK